MREGEPCTFDARRNERSYRSSDPLVRERLSDVVVADAGSDLGDCVSGSQEQDRMTLRFHCEIGTSAG
jgi:hypothetical protein